MAGFVVSEKFKLLTRSSGLLWFLSVKYFKITKLLVGNAEYAHLSKFRKKRLDALDVHLGILHTGTMADVGRELEHGEPVTLQFLAKLCVGLAVTLGLGRQVKLYNHPHNAIFTEAFHTDISSYLSG